VWVTSRDADKLAWALEIGADGAFESGAKLPGKVDAVMETVGDATWAHSMRSLRPGGTIVISGATSGPNPPADLNRLFFLQLRIIGSTMGTIGELRDLVDLLVRKGVRPIIDRVLPMERAAEAFSVMASGDVRGKLVLTR
jgi:D-arabinose 1-dehydrogenase-like Zn-dependent alcohol dehydrogenase